MSSKFRIGELVNSTDNAKYENQRQCMEVMIDNGVIPVVNENDTVSITELMFTENDELSGLIARMMTSVATTAFNPPEEE